MDSTRLLHVDHHLEGVYGLHPVRTKPCLHSLLATAFTPAELFRLKEQMRAKSIVVARLTPPVRPNLFLAARPSVSPQRANIFATR
ncbi:MAG: hypothetical protein ABIZ04_02465 [Opitutus sp.]